MRSPKSLIGDLLRETLSGPAGSFVVLSSKHEASHYIQWLNDGHELVVEIADTEANEGEPLDARQKEAIDGLGFSQGAPNFERWFSDPGRKIPEIAGIVASALAEVFGLEDSLELAIIAEQAEVEADDDLGEETPTSRLHAESPSLLQSFSDIPGVSWPAVEESQGSPPDSSYDSPARSAWWEDPNGPAWDRLQRALALPGTPLDYADILAFAFVALSDWKARRADPSSMARAEEAAQWLIELGEAALEKGWAISFRAVALVDLYLVEGLVDEARRAAVLLQAFDEERSEYTEETQARVRAMTSVVEAERSGNE